MYLSPKKLILLSACLVSMHSVAYEEKTLFNQVHVQAQVERDIPNNEMQTLLVSEHQGKNATAMSKQVNKDIQWAVGRIKRNSAIEVSTRAYQTYPIYRESDVVGWRVSQEIQLKSQDMAAMSEMIGELQEKLQVRQMHFSANKESRDKIENELIEEAMEAFKRRASIIQKHMDEKDYRIVNIHINSNSQRPQLMHAQRGRMKTMEMASAPTVEAGTSKITVNVTGSVQFY